MEKPRKVELQGLDPVAAMVAMGIKLPEHKNIKVTDPSHPFHSFEGYMAVEVRGKDPHIAALFILLGRRTPMRLNPGQWEKL